MDSILLQYIYARINNSSYFFLVPRKKMLNSESDSSPAAVVDHVCFRPEVKIIGFCDAL